MKWIEYGRKLERRRRKKIEARNQKISTKTITLLVQLSSNIVNIHVCMNLNDIKIERTKQNKNNIVNGELCTT